MYDWISPNLIIPVHGEFRHLNEQANFAKKCGIKKQIVVENGSVVLLKKENSRILDKINSGRCLLKGNQIVSMKNNFLSYLRNVSIEGEFFVNLIMNVDNELLSDPVIFCPTVTKDIDLIKNLSSLISNEIDNLKNSSITDEVMISEIKIKIRSFIKKNIGLKPLTDVEIVRI